MGLWFLPELTSSNASKSHLELPHDEENGEIQGVSIISSARRSSRQDHRGHRIITGSDTDDQG